MKALLTLIVVLNFLGFASLAGEIPLVLPEKKSPGGARAPAVAPKRSKKSGKKSAKKRTGGKSKISRKTVKPRSGQKPVSRANRSASPAKRRTASSGDRARVEAYFKKDTFSQDQDLSPSSEDRLPAQVKVGIKHSVREE